MKVTKRSKTKVVEKNQVDRKKESKSKENNSQSILFDSIFSRIDESNEEPNQTKEALTQKQPLLTLPELKEIAKVTEEKEKQKELLKSKQKENAELVLVGKEGEETEKDEGVEPTPLSTPTPILDPSLEPEPTPILSVESKPKIVVSQSYFELNEGDSFDISNYYEEWLHEQHVKFVDEQGEKILDRLMDEKLQQTKKSDVGQPTQIIHGGEEK